MATLITATTLSAFEGVTDGILSDLEVFGGSLITLTYGGDYAQRFAIGAAGDLAHSAQQTLAPTSVAVGSGGDLHLIALDGATYAASLGTQDFYEVDVGGVLIDGSAIMGDLALQTRIDAIATLELAGSTYVYASDYGSGRTQAYRLDGGALVGIGEAQQVTLGAPDQIRDLQAVTVGSTSLLLSFDAATDTILTHLVGTDGLPVLTDTTSVAESIGFQNLTALKAATIDDTAYVIGAGATSGSLSVFEVTSTGALIPRDHILDDQDSRFAGAHSLATVRNGDHVYIAAAGSDDGITLFQLLPGGQLFQLTSVTDNHGLSLDNVEDVALSLQGTTLSIHASSQSEWGVTHLVFDISAQGALLSANASGQSLSGTALNDVLAGGAGADTISGGDGDDVLLDGAGVDVLTGGDGADTFKLTRDSAEDVITDFNPIQDRLDLSEYLLFYAADQLLVTPTAGGARIAYYGEVTQIFSHDGSTLSYGDFAAQDLTNVSRLFTGSALADLTLEGTSAADVLIGGFGADTLNGNDGDDILRGGLLGDVLSGGAGRDLADYSFATQALTVDLLLEAQNTGEAAGDDFISIEGVIGTGFADVLRGDFGANELMGGAGDDELFGRAGNDTLIGGDGDDFLRGGVGADHLDGGAGVDLADYAQSKTDLILDLLYPHQNSGEAAGDTYAGIDGLLGGAGNDILRGVFTAETLVGGGGADVLFGRAGNDTLVGGDGDDLLRGGVGADHLDGGAGLDLADYAQSKTDLILDLLYPHQNTGEAAGDTYAGIDGLLGGSGDDTLRGVFTADVLLSLIHI